MCVAGNLTLRMSNNMPLAFIFSVFPQVRRVALASIAIALTHCDLSKGRCIALSLPFYSKNVACSALALFDFFVNWHSIAPEKFSRYPLKY